MTDWSGGYVTDIGYTHGYYRELCPALQRFALIAAGYNPPPEDGAYLELGYGQGLAAAIHAAATPNAVWGTDFMPSQAANARSLLEASGCDAQLFDDNFADFATRRTLPEFAYISLHGIWSWVSEENRRHIVNVLRRHQVVGGVTYISYNALPGWSASIPLQQLLAIHADVAGAKVQGVGQRLDAAITFVQKLAGQGARYFADNPQAMERLNHMAGQDRHYLAHEYLNRDGSPMSFWDIAERLSAAKLEFATSAFLMDHVDAVNLTAGAQAMLREISHPILRQSVRDYFINAIFRRDLFVRGPRRLTSLGQYEALLSMRFVMLTRPEDVQLNMICPVGPIQLDKDVYRPLMDAIAKDDYRPRSLRDLHRELSKLTFVQLVQAITLLIGGGFVHTAQADEVAAKAKPRTDALNTELCRRAQSSANVQHLASPILGGGVFVDRVQQLFLKAAADGKKTPGDRARAAWDILSAQGQKLTASGKVLEKPEENLAELTVIAQKFAEQRLPIFKAIQIA